MIRRAATMAAVSAVLLGACSGETTAPTTTVPTTTTSTSTTTTSTTTTTTTTTTTIPVAPETVPIVPTTLEPIEVPRAAKATGPCTQPVGSHYCIWGTKPVDLTVNNSRVAAFNLSVDQTFTAVDEYVSAVTVQVVSRTIGALTEATDSTADTDVCMRLTLSADGGLPLATIGYTVKSTRGVTQDVEAPLESAVIPGKKYTLSLAKGPACAARDISTFVAMSSKWKYPRKAGSMILDGRTSNGSLWARID